ncbi:RNA polymerase sigma factor [Granulicella tundricola]|uniref:RNA polymerase, sigma-24 subunit, ECF subfamily n=1 Tax=Granulicella tundricola (strain ATCC BAA-1859 / DSM 23138 / MP5ACTX9) TaxID=1198114 RepID=E8WYG0_GRATM|nr:sigma-70 family RNA polymerase sigma factor [Granulicella tundricola]ADW69866.1 RNA polymerase, sigma-24 subunit, ECF subfamily [Granulicella tundricola MP5ACTX9]
MISATLQPEAAAATLDTPAPISIDALHAQYSPRIFRFILASVHDRDLAQTLTQDTFLRAWSSMNSDAQFRGESSEATWLTRIALNLVRDHTRTNRFRFWRSVSATAIEASDLSHALAHPDSTNESRLIASQQLTLIWATVSTLSERQRTVFLLRFVEEFELAHIAEITAMPLPTVKTHLYRALAVIRKAHPLNTKEAK